MTDITVAFRPFFRQARISRATREHPFIGMPIPGEETAPVRSRPYFTTDPFIHGRSGGADQGDPSRGRNPARCNQSRPGCGEHLLLDKERKIWRCAECGGAFSELQLAEPAADNQPAEVKIVEQQKPQQASSVAAAAGEGSPKKKTSHRSKCTCGGQGSVPIWQLNAFALVILFLVLFFFLLTWMRLPK